MTATTTSCRQAEPVHVDIQVKLSTGTYQTTAVNGVKASCTAGEKQAAERFGEKFFGPAYVGVELVRAGTPYKPATWRVNADPTGYAWAWASGLIEVFDVPPDRNGGALLIATGPRRALHQALAMLAREGLGKSAGKLLVPGVPEAKSQHDAMTSLILWVNDCKRRNGQARMHGVVFGRGREELMGESA